MTDDQIPFVSSYHPSFHVISVMDCGTVGVVGSAVFSTIAYVTGSDGVAGTGWIVHPQKAIARINKPGQRRELKSIVPEELRDYKNIEIGLGTIIYQNGNIEYVNSHPIGVCVLSVSKKSFRRLSDTYWPFGVDLKRLFFQIMEINSWSDCLFIGRVRDKCTIRLIKYFYGKND